MSQYHPKIDLWKKPISFIIIPENPISIFNQIMQEFYLKIHKKSIKNIQNQKKRRYFFLYQKNHVIIGSKIEEIRIKRKLMMQVTYSILSLNLDFLEGRVSH